MTPHLFARRLWLPYPLEEVFAFFERPENLERLTPPSLGFRMLTPSVVMREGALMDYTIRLLGMPVRWTTLIDSYDPPHRFSDVQLRGPYSYWHHTHRFESKDGGTLMTDEVRYLLPLEPLGRLALPLIGWQLDRIFRFRSEAIRAVFPEQARRSS
jgi:ligand-binding SRPBCC domain-containing protein